MIAHQMSARNQDAKTSLIEKFDRETRRPFKRSLHSGDTGKSLMNFMRICYQVDFAQQQV
jgi:hypothetical protein